MYIYTYIYIYLYIYIYVYISIYIILSLVKFPIPPLLVGLSPPPSHPDPLTLFGKP